jgi:uncharacterized protein (DUF433 family)
MTWAKNGVFVPSRIYVTSHRPYTLFYSFTDLVALRVVSILRERYGLSLQAAKVAADEIRDNSDTPWSNMSLWLDGTEICIADPGKSDSIRIDLESIAADVRKDADRLWMRDPANYGKIEYRRDVMGGTLVVKGTRISVATVVNMTAQGASEEEILRAYPSLVPEDIRGVREQMAEQRRVA